MKTIGRIGYVVLALLAAYTVWAPMPSALAASSKPQGMDKAAALANCQKSVQGQLHSLGLGRDLRATSFCEDSVSIQN